MQWQYRYNDLRKEKALEYIVQIPMKAEYSVTSSVGPALATGVYPII